MSEQDQDKSAPAAPPKPAVSMKVKVGFLVVVCAIIVAVTYKQWKGPEYDGALNSLDEALVKAKSENRPVVVFFTSYPSGDVDAAISKTVGQPANRDAIKKGNFILVKIATTTAMDSPDAKAYKITSLPTTLLLDSQGNERNRRVGMIGEVAFRNGFLDRSVVEH